MRTSNTFLATILLLASSASNAIVVNAFDQGWYDNAGRHFSSNINYSAGSYTNTLAFEEWHNFFAFDLSGISGNVTSAVFRLHILDTDNGAHTSTNGIFSLYDVNTSLSALLADSSSDIQIFNDLGSGNSYGSKALSTLDAYTFRDIVFNSEGLAAINNTLGGTFAFGGNVDNLFRIGGGTPFFPPTLTLTVDETVPMPAPISLALLVIGLAGIGVSVGKAGKGS